MNIDTLQVTYDLYDIVKALNSKGWNFHQGRRHATDVETTLRLTGRLIVFVIKREYGAFVLHRETTSRRFTVAGKTLNELTAEIWSTLVLQASEEAA